MFTLHQISFSFHYIHVLAGWLYRFTWLRPAERKQATCSDAGAAHTHKKRNRLKVPRALPKGRKRVSERKKMLARKIKLKTRFFPVVRLFYSLHFCFGTICINVYFKQRTISSALFTCIVHPIQWAPCSTKHKTSNRAAKINLLANATRDAN